MLWLLAKAELRQHPDPAMPGTVMHDPGFTKVTPDELADTFLRQIIREKYPQLPEHLSSIDKLEKEIIKSLQSK